MNIHRNTPTPADPVLTPSERMSRLIDALTMHDVRVLAVEQLSDFMGINDGNADPAALKLIDDRINAEIDAGEAVIACLKALMEDGILERCVDLLKTANRPM